MPFARLRRLLPAVAAALLCALAPRPSAGQAVTKAELDGYRLTMANVERLLAVARNMKALENDPELKAWAAKNRAEEEDASGSAEGPDAEAAAIGHVITRLNEQPKLRQAVQSAGISPRDYALTTYMLLVSSMPVAAEKQYGKQIDTKGMPAAVVANIALVRSNWTRISAMGEELKKYQVRALESGSDDAAPGGDEGDEGDPA